MKLQSLWRWIRFGLPGRQLFVAVVRNQEAAERLDFAIREMLKK